jgi:outer membrane immunogenic protein
MIFRFGTQKGSIMKKLAFAVASATVLISAPALAADLGRPVYKAPPPVAVQYYNWSGFYIGGFIGGAFTDRDVTVTELGAQPGGVVAAGTPYNFLGSFSHRHDDSFIGGGTIGWNWQVPGSQWVFGIEGEVGSLRIRGSGPDPLSAGLDTVSRSRIGDFYALITGRVGVAWDRALFYVKGGGAFVERRANVFDTCIVAPCGPATIDARGRHDDFTWTVGGGIEYALWQNWTIKGEYMFIDTRQDGFNACGAAGGALAGSTYCWRHELPGLHTVKLGFNYKFNWGLPGPGSYPGSY